jgi:hypothetical protein
MESKMCIRFNLCIVQIYIGVDEKYTTGVKNIGGTLVFNNGIFSTHEK